MHKRTHRLTQHVIERMNERKIPAALIQETIEKGDRTIHLDRRAVEHKLKNVLGIKGCDVVVIVSADDGNILTSYVERRRVVRKMPQQE